MGFKEKKMLKCNTQESTKSLDPGDMWTSPGAELSHFIKGPTCQLLCDTAK